MKSDYLSYGREHVDVKIQAQRAKDNDFQDNRDILRKIMVFSGKL